MKRIIATAVLTFALHFLFAQQITDLYKFNTTKQTDAVVKTLAKELKLSPEELKQVHELLDASATSQVEQYAKPGNEDVHVIETIVRRQTQHIEANLQRIIGIERFKEYSGKKPAIEQQVKALKNTN